MGVDYLAMQWRGSTDHVRLATAHPERDHGLVAGCSDASLLGRSHECGVIDRLVRDAGSGRSGVLVLRGEPGVGKTALADYAVECAQGFAVARAVGVESEMELPFAALHQFCRPFLDRLERLPGPQADALQIVFGLHAGPVPDRFLVGLAALTLLSEAAAQSPLLCVVDDAQWLDQASAQALMFVARRLLAESVALLFVTRDPQAGFAGLPELVVEGLAERDARELLDSVVRGPMDARVREQILAETRGNPLALRELPVGLSPAQLAGGFGLPGALSLSGRIEESFQRRLEDLPEETRLLLVLAAAEPAGDAALVWRAAERLGIARTALEPAERVGLIEVRPGIRFRHPLVRSAVYGAASSGERRMVHEALGEAIDGRADPDRRVWHLAQAAWGPDEAVAAELERSAGRAQRRGGLAAAAAFLDRAVALTVDQASRAQRALAAADAKHLAGESEAALRLLAIAQLGPLDELARARVELVGDQIEHAQHRGSDAAGRLLVAGERFKTLDVALSREIYLQGLSAATVAGRRGQRGGVRDVAQAALTAPPAPDPPRACDLLLDGLTTRFTVGYSAAAPTVKRALRAFPGEAGSSVDELRWLWLACRTAVDLWDDQAWEALSTRHLRLARESGALTVLPLALSQRISVLTFSGQLADARSLIEEMQAAVDATESELPPYGALMLAAWQGREPDVSGLVDTIRSEVVPRGEGLGLTVGHWASAVLYNGLGRYDEALNEAEQASEHSEDLGFHNCGLVELIVAAARGGSRERATAALERLEEITQASGTDWALGIEARSRALVSDDPEAAERLYREAIERLSRTRIRVDLARAHLLYGEWLRRERRRVDAREQLRIAYDMFTRMGAEAFAARAERELLATGERARKRSVETRGDLTAQEVQIARLARDGLSNPEIGARLFISPRTVEYHLHKVFSKLNIGSRNQLAAALPAELDAVPASE
jgi:DNA-binding CsgD family transcriptional regulator/tetratricopeptide (TPR) repeat protein